ncbi:ATP-binding protein [Corallococcus aberystwythensis]|uniref:ATP-binding protein n=1 Tax=Corallococcus aberystwythensis TaxID=2316722 RepID=A0A3A8PF32_9BACT|nr:ATP-binding protein [Corallococcus aberystwythensis]RKH54933.1 ATP-binding protein [Corallococcus aberystwythensis]
MSWESHNRAFLSAALRRVHFLLERHSDPSLATPAELPAFDDEGWPPWPESEECPPVLRELCEQFKLTPFERDTLLLCVGMELDARFPALCARAQGDANRPWPTFSLALATIPGSHWDALSPQGALRHWGLIALGTGTSLTLAPLRAEERVWQYLLGIEALDERLSQLLQPLPEPGPLVPSHERIARQVAATLASATREPELPVIQLSGRSRRDQLALAVRATELLELELRCLPSEALPSSREEGERLAKLWNREALLNRVALVVDCHDLDTHAPERMAALARLTTSVRGVLLFTAPERLATGTRGTVLLEVPLPAATEQRGLWLEALGRHLRPEAFEGWRLPQATEVLINQFDLDRPAIDSAVTHAMGQLQLVREPGPEQVQAALWQGACAQSRRHLETLAQRLEVRASWEDLLLPDPVLQQLREVEFHLRHRLLVHETWGLTSGGWRGTGTSILLSGPPGTGKTLAAEVLAHSLGLDLYRIDLSGVVSKYIGETEKNLRRVFDAAESGGAVLLFDEADSLFGKRSEVKDSHDRHANIEVSYLLQRMESFRGLALLTTNLKSGLDPAFTRRLRFIIDFAFPDRKQRAAMWRRVFSAQMPAEGLEPERLAVLNVSGAAIRSIALHAAVLAAEESSRAGTPAAVRPRHVIAAARREFEKLQQPFPNPREFEGWD